MYPSPPPEVSSHRGTHPDPTTEERAGMPRRRSPRLHPQIHASEEGAGMARRRSPYLHPQIQASEETPGMARRRSTRLHPQINASEDGAGVTSRSRSPRLHPQFQEIENGAGGARRHNPRLLHPQIHASEEGAGRILRRCGKSPAAAASLPDDDDMLREILLRLPPQPSSLPRASAVCKRWRGLVTDPRFHRQFYAHHRKPPLLGVFVRPVRTDQAIAFNPIPDPPDRVPPEHLDLGLDHGCYDLLDCRHGLVLVIDRVRDEVVVCDPIIGQQRRAAIPMQFKGGLFSGEVGLFSGAVLCAAADLGHVHGGCHSSPFKVVLMFTSGGEPIACVYSSETGGWGKLISTAAPCEIYNAPSVLVGNCLYWMRDDILQFDLVENNLTVIKLPPNTPDVPYWQHQIIQTENGVFGLAILCYPHFRIWQRSGSDNGVATWVPWKTTEMHNIPGLSLQIGGRIRFLLGYDEDNVLIFLYANQSVYAVQPKSMQSKKLYETNCINRVHPFTSFCTPGTSIDGGSNGAEMLHNS